VTYQDKLDEQINAVLERLQELGQKWEPKWITKEICDRHTGGLREEDESVEDAVAFWRFTGSGFTRDAVRRRINARAETKPEDQENPRQSVLEGFDRLQSYYLVRRGGEDLGVPVQGMTDAELDAKAAQIRRMGDGCHAHSDELIRYKNERPKQRQA
jgi:hypothetical protein